jgi:hypothetical protein
LDPAHTVRRQVRRSRREAARKEPCDAAVHVRERALEILPSSGGLNAWVARSRITGVVLTGANSAGIKIRGTRNLITGKSDLKSIDAGAVRHPVYSNRGQWVEQAVRPGFFTDAVTEEGRKQLEDAALNAVDRAAEMTTGATARLAQGVWRPHPSARLRCSE